MAYTILVVALTLFISQSEACFPTQTTPPPTATACPMDGKTCVGEGNMLELKSANGLDVCSKRTIWRNHILCT